MCRCVCTLSFMFLWFVTSFPFFPSFCLAWVGWGFVVPLWCSGSNTAQNPLQFPPRAGASILSVCCCIPYSRMLDTHRGFISRVPNAEVHAGWLQSCRGLDLVYGSHPLLGDAVHQISMMFLARTGHYVRSYVCPPPSAITWPDSFFALMFSIFIFLFFFFLSFALFCREHSHLTRIVPVYFIWHPLTYRT